MRRRWALLVPLLALIAPACDGDAAEGGDARTLTVSAASSLTDAFVDVGAAFEAEHAGVTVTFNFGPSDGLAAQINEAAATVDVFASASGTWMDAVQQDGPGVTGRADFAQNELAIVVPSENPAGIEGVTDLANDGVALVLAAEGVPAGDYAREVLANAGIADAALANVVSNADDVRAVVTAVVSGDADAGIVYVTDVTDDVADRATLVPIPDDVNVIATYPIAVVADAPEADLARQFVDYVLGDGQRILADYGFLPAP